MRQSKHTRSHPHRKHRKIIVGLLGALLLVLAALQQPAVAQQGFVVIVHPSNPVSSVSAEELSRIFLKKTVKWGNGTRTEPVDLASSSAVRARFSQAVHGKGTAAISAYWQKMIFSGREIPPAELGTAAEVIAFVASHRGGVGYVAEGTALGEGVKAIRISP
jgi:ABC-type phosphate transport system substrate-binding protein